MTYKDFRISEITQSVIKFYEEMEQLHVKRIDLMQQEIEAWRHLKQVLLADSPELLSKYFQS